MLYSVTCHILAYEYFLNASECMASEKNWDSGTCMRARNGTNMSFPYKCLNTIDKQLFVTFNVIVDVNAFVNVFCVVN